MYLNSLGEALRAAASVTKSVYRAGEALRAAASVTKSVYRAGVCSVLH